MNSVVAGFSVKDTFIVTSMTYAPVVLHSHTATYSPLPNSVKQHFSGVPCFISNSYPCDISLSCYVYSSAVSGMTDFMSDLASNQSLVSTISSDYHGYLGLLKKHADDKKPTTPTSRRSSLSSKQTAAKNKQLKGLAKMVVMFK